MVSFRSLAGLCAVALLAGATPAAAQIAGQPWASLRTTVPLPPQTESGRVDVGDVELYYAIYGKGRPVVLLHPGLGHSDYWANQIGPLSQEFQVGVVDLRGHGRSGASARPFTYALIADDPMALLIGFADTFGKVWLPDFASVATYAIMAVVLLWRPQGLFGRA